MVSGRNSKAVRGARASVVTKRSTPWGTIAAVLVVLLFAGGIFGYAFVQNRTKAEAAAALAKFTPSATNQDPSTQITGIVAQQYAGGQHVTPDKQVAYTHSPPFGGSHGQPTPASAGSAAGSSPRATRTSDAARRTRSSSRAGGTGQV